MQAETTPLFTNRQPSAPAVTNTGSAVKVSSKVGFARRDREGLLIFKARRCFVQLSSLQSLQDSKYGRSW